MRIGWILILCLTLVACGQGQTGTSARIAITMVAPDAVPTTTLTDPVLIEGQTNYNLYCGHCHGYNGAGQVPESIQQTLDLGMLLVPAHDSTGHTWQHPDQLLIRTVRQGIQNPLAQFQMPAYGDALTDEQILGIFDYISLWWTEEQREHQGRMTEHWNDMAAAITD